MTRLTPLSLIRQKSQLLLKESRSRKPPIKVEVIAKKLGIIVRYEPFEDDISGVLYRDRKQTIIGVSSLHHPNRQRFTIAHELGHFILHEMDVHVDKGYRVVLRDGTSSQAVDPLEIDANRFAAELLMPLAMLEGDVNEYIQDVEDTTGLRALAGRYGVSTQAMAIRLGNTGLLPQFASS